MRFFSLLAIYALIVSTAFAQTKTPAEQKVISGIVLLNDKTAPDAKAILAALKKDWKLKVDSATTADKTIVFSDPGGATVMIAHLDYPVPQADIQVAGKISWLWKGGTAEALRHQSQAVISVVGPAKKALDLYKLFTSVAAGVLEKTNASGVYMGGQYLILSRGFYTSAARNMRDNQTIPLYCWVYIGMTQDEAQQTNSAYTFGLQELGLREMEIVHSKQSLSDVQAILYDAAQTVVKYNLKLQDGQNFTTLEGQKLTAKLSKAAFQEGETLKLEF